MENNLNRIEEDVLTVRITLAEYRNLVSEAAELNALRIAKWAAEDNLKKADERIDELLKLLGKEGASDE